MVYSVALYCPDRHLSYDARTPDRVGVGGGLTARIRLCHALARLGHAVTLVGNCPREEVVDGVHYVPLSRCRSLRADVLVLNSSGGALDLRPVLDIAREAHLTLVWVQGLQAPAGLTEVRFDFVYAPSNFIRGVVQREWSVRPEKTFVVYNGIPRSAGRPLLPWPRVARDPHRLIYTSHPSKGLAAAIGVLRCLRREDPRFELHVFGGARLWGQAEEPPRPEPGLVYHGLVGQRQLAGALEEASVSLHLQARPEPFGISLAEARRAGCIVLASPVGAFPELIEHGRNGFLIPGDHLAENTWQQAAGLILALLDNPAHAQYVRGNARAIVWDWETIARVWTGHWDWLLAKRHASARSGATSFTCTCPVCGAPMLALSDGYHCTGCGRYTQAISRECPP